MPAPHRNARASRLGLQSHAIFITRSFINLGSDGNMRMSHIAKQESPVYALESYIEGRSGSCPGPVVSV